nr:MAG TPA: major tail protein [Caudoviricetes sp.]
MAVINRGKSNDYVLGAGKVEFNLFPQNDATKAKGFRYLGSTSEFNLTKESETLEHKNSESGLTFTDAEVVTSSTLSGTLTVDNIVAENLALFFAGDIENVVQVAKTGEKHIAKIYRGLGYVLGTTDINPNGVFKATVTKVEVFGSESDARSGTGGSVVPPAQYNADVDTAFIAFDKDAAAVAADGQWAVITYDLAAATREVVVSKSQAINGALRFVSDNATGTNRVYYMPKVTLTPNGDFSLKSSDNWQTIGFNLKAVKKDDVAALLYLNSQPLA